MKEYYNLSSRTFFDEDGRKCEITNMFDIIGDETDDPCECVIFVAKRSAAEWLTIDTRDFEDARVS